VLHFTGIGSTISKQRLLIGLEIEPIALFLKNISEHHKHWQTLIHCKVTIDVKGPMLISVTFS
jgi:hypothetical protein